MILVRSMKFLAPLIAAVTLVGSAQAASAALTLPQFERQLVQQLGGAQWNRLYAELHPAQQRIISRGDFSRCMAAVVRSAAKRGVSYSSLRFIDAQVQPKKRTTVVPGTRLRVKAIVVRMRWSVVERGVRRVVQGERQYVVKADGRWRWMQVVPPPGDFAKKSCGLPR